MFTVGRESFRPARGTRGEAGWPRVQKGVQGLCSSIFFPSTPLASLQHLPSLCSWPCTVPVPAARGSGEPAPNSAIFLESRREVLCCSERRLSPTPRSEGVREWGRPQGWSLGHWGVLFMFQAWSATPSPPCSLWGDLAQYQAAWGVTVDEGRCHRPQCHPLNSHTQKKPKTKPNLIFLHID